MAPVAASTASTQSGYCSVTARYTNATSGCHSRNLPYTAFLLLGIMDSSGVHEDMCVCVCVHVLGGAGRGENMICTVDSNESSLIKAVKMEVEGADMSGLVLYNGLSLNQPARWGEGGKMWGGGTLTDLERQSQHCQRTAGRQR